MRLPALPPLTGWANEFRRCAAGGARTELRCHGFARKNADRGSRKIGVIRVHLREMELANDTRNAQASE